MYTVAQRRGFFNKMRESLSPSGLMESSLLSPLNPEFKQMMDDLRATDEPIRAILEGEDAEDDDNRHTKEILKSARSMFNRREYMRSIAELGRFHDRMQRVSKKLADFKGNIDKVHHAFLFKDLDEDTEKYLKEKIKPRFTRTEASARNNIKKEAGIADFFHNLTDDRARALKAWEKRYPKQVKALKSSLSRLLDRSDALWSSTLSVLKVLATALATRKVDDYIMHSQKIINGFKTYDTMFKEFYDAQVKGFLDKPGVQAPPSGSIPAVPDLEIGAPAKPPAGSTGPTGPAAGPPTGPAAGPASPSAGPASPSASPASPPAGPAGSAATLTQEVMKGLREPISLKDQLKDLIAQRASLELEHKNASPQMKKAIRDRYNDVDNKIHALEAQIAAEQQKASDHVTSAHANFIESLESLSNENPIILAKYISKYASMIRSSDPVNAIKLMNIVKLIKG